MEIFHVMGAVSILSHMAFTSWTESLDRILLAFLHFDIRIILDTGHSFTCVDFVGVDWVAIEVLHDFNRINFALYLYLIGLHGLLNQATDIP